MSDCSAQTKPATTELTIAETTPNVYDNFTPNGVYAEILPNTEAAATPENHQEATDTVLYSELQRTDAGADSLIVAPWTARSSAEAYSSFNSLLMLQTEACQWF